MALALVAIFCVSPFQLRQQRHVPEEPSVTDNWKLLDPHEPKKQDLKPFKKGQFHSQFIHNDDTSCLLLRVGQWVGGVEVSGISCVSDVCSFKMVCEFNMGGGSKFPGLCVSEVCGEC